ncbi:MAG: TIGR04086 family membrane protein [Syntrophomonadaceae bacterium]|nr:TIGR04086 family membrane protein [Syntrophomonadaceae bacterium]
MKIPIEVQTLAKSIVLGLLLAALLGGAVYFSPLPESLLPLLGNAIMAVCVLLGAVLISKHYGQKGLIHGLSFGVIFFTVMIIASLIFSADAISLKSFAAHLLGCLLSGALGGIIGIGMSDL